MGMGLGSRGGALCSNAPPLTRGGQNYWYWLILMLILTIFLKLILNLMSGVILILVLNIAKQTCKCWNWVPILICNFWILNLNLDIDKPKLNLEYWVLILRNCFVNVEFEYRYWRTKSSVLILILNSILFLDNVDFGWFDKNDYWIWNSLLYKQKRNVEFILKWHIDVMTHSST